MPPPARGYDAAGHRARQFDPAWFDKLDLVVVFDRGQERTVREWAPDDASRAKVQLLLSFDESGGPGSGGDVPDPYYSDAALFDSVLATIERASTALFRQLEPALR